MDSLDSSIADSKPALGVSACLLGESVRYDGAHKRSALLQASLSGLLSMHGFCPELSAGFGVPRPTIALYEDAGAVELRRNPGQQGKLDLKENLAPAMIQSCEEIFRACQNLNGYIFMQRSPSCALASAQLISDQRSSDQANSEARYIDGVFAAELKRRLPALPVVQECDLHHGPSLDRFLVAVYAHHRLSKIQQSQSFSELLDFHSRYKYTVMAYSVPAYKRLGKLLACRNADNFSAQFEEYRLGFMQIFKQEPSRGAIVNALMHIMGYVKQQLSAEQSQQLLGQMHAYRLGEQALQPIIVELHNAIELWGSEYIRRQYFWCPHPLSEQLRAL
ncbi:DUF523 and DUF1722 domain-containing protein [uncultured Pseudoteredinibacter sp.]|uniref:DUF523 and DUF1722 domain-containing protein n=1 Tax=uncultured Pseudoteredinibacter sp. TaxID=1641701 RepID=UPI00263339AA|nr:DUF523 and DUF1722 domain-containing protein [uncultured Pseudoteredinibacter sp.]